MTNEINELLISGLKEKAYPGAVLLVAQGEDIVFFHNVGNRAVKPKPLPMEKETTFDLASLTKPLATTLAIMKLVDEGLLDLDKPISYLIQPFPSKDKADITPRLLLNHSAGLPDWKPFYLELIKYPLEERKSVLQQSIMEEPLYHEPKTVSLYSDLGFILLEWIIEITAGQDLSSFLNVTFYRPLGLETLYLDQITADPIYEKNRFAATEYCPWRKEIIQGHVHDENAYALGGYSGHAGLFGTALDVFTLTTALVKIYHGTRSDLLSTETVRTFFSRQGIVPKSTYALGWDTPAEKNSSAGSYFSPISVGHTGFTGTSVWIDLEKNIAVIFLTNRIHPSRSNEKIKDFRPKLHNLIMQELGYA
ncbi:MAG: class A beta-lactamase-related serine hydrolase [Desulfobacteraceae bacterium]|nr:MAG: class A beta-lactamase-related serine hydrolase [Desulfobacteraceae bacterium]